MMRSLFLSHLFNNTESGQPVEILICRLLLFLVFTYQNTSISSITTSSIAMRSAITTIATLLVTHWALAAPQPSSTTAASATVIPPSSYYLKTRVVGHGHRDRDGLYVSNYHTGKNPARSRRISAQGVRESPSPTSPQVPARPI